MSNARPMYTFFKYFLVVDLLVDVVLLIVVLLSCDMVREQSQPLFLILRLGLTTGTGSSELSYLIKKKEVSNIRNHCLLAACFIIELRKLDF